MPKEISPGAAWKDTITVPRDGEGIDAADVELPLSDLLANDKSLRQMLLTLEETINDLRTVQGGFTVVAPGAITLEPGRSYAVQVGVGRYDGFSGAVDFSTQGLPAGVTATFDPASAAGDTTTMTLSASSGVVAGTYDFFVVGVSGEKNYGARMQITLADATLPATFDVIMPDRAGIDRAVADTQMVSLDITRQGGFSDPIAFEAVGLPAGVSVHFDPNPVTGNASSQPGAVRVTLSAVPTVAAGTYNIQVRASSGSRVVTRALALSITAAPVAGVPDFSLRVVYDSGDPLVRTGATLYIDRAAGYSGAVRVSVPQQGQGPVFLLNGQPWELVTSSDQVRLTVSGAGRTSTITGNLITRTGLAPASVISQRVQPVSSMRTVAVVQPAYGSTTPRRLADLEAWWTE